MILDRKAVEKLTKTNNQLVAYISQSSNQLAQANANIVALRKQMLEMKTGRDRGRRRRFKHYY